MLPLPGDRNFLNKGEITESVSTLRITLKVDTAALDDVIVLILHRSGVGHLFSMCEALGSDNSHAHT